MNGTKKWTDTVALTNKQYHSRKNLVFLSYQLDSTTFQTLCYHLA